MVSTPYKVWFSSVDQFPHSIDLLMPYLQTAQHSSDYVEEWLDRNIGKENYRIAVYSFERGLLNTRCTFRTAELAVIAKLGFC